MGLDPVSVFFRERVQGASGSGAMPVVRSTVLAGYESFLIPLFVSSRCRIRFLMHRVKRVEAGWHHVIDATQQTMNHGHSRLAWCGVASMSFIETTDEEWYEL